MPNKKTILYIDNERSKLKLFSDLFRRNYNIYEATSVDEGLHLFDEYSFDLVISGDQLPKKSGLEFLELIRKQDGLIPIIFLTSKIDSEGAKEELIKDDASIFISKPYDPKNLSVIMDLAIEGYLLKRDKHKIKSELDLSEDKFYSIFSTMADVFVRVGLDGIIQLASPSAKNLTGYSQEELIGMDISLLYADTEERDKIRAILTRVKIIRDREILLRTKSGEKKWLVVTLAVFFDKNGNPAGTEGILRDITERKEMEQLVYDKNKLLDETQRIANVGSLHYNLKTNSTIWTDTLATIYGINKLNPIDNTLESFINFFDHSERSRARSYILNALRRGEDFSFEAKINRQDNKDRLLSFNGRAIQEGDNQNTKLTIACLDITEAKHRESELIKSEEKFRLLAEELPIRIIKVDKRLNVLYANKLSYSYMGNPNSKKLKIYSFFERDILSLIIESIHVAIGNEKGSYLEYEYQAKWFSLTISLVREASGIDNMLLLIQDISEKKESERILKNLNQELEVKVANRTKELEKAKSNIEVAYKKEKELGELKSQFVSTASHQFRTPLTVIQSNIGLLEMQVQSTDQEFKKKFYRVYERIESEIKRMTDLMDHVLILGKKESGVVKPNLQMVDILALSQAIVKKHNEIQEDGRSIEVTYTGKIIMYHLDPELFENAFSNLISNAFKYSKSKESPLVHLHYNLKELIITIQDFGVGVPEKDIKHIFEPFYRASNVKDIAGTGLGTSIIKAYLDLMDIEIELKSKLNEGSTFTLKIKK
mgnify:CR=1 FL=1|tara:strand:- start:2791 stop:5100 length:2310 start_codon:yes stop_codon:yes gene_type:complete